MARKFLSSVVLAAAALIGCTGIPDGLEPVTGFEPARYMGTWYEIARLDHSFERNLSNVSATYSRAGNGDILVRNKGFNTSTGVWKQVEGHARFLKDDTVGSLKVSFFGPFYGGYHMIALDKENYSYAVVTGPSRSYLWILSRSKTLDMKIYSDLLSKAQNWGFDLKRLTFVEHDMADS